MVSSVALATLDTRRSPRRSAPPLPERRERTRALAPAIRPRAPTIRAAIPRPLLAPSLEPELALELLEAPPASDSVAAGAGGAVSEPATSSSTPPGAVTSIWGAGSSESGPPIQRTTSPLS